MKIIRFNESFLKSSNNNPYLGAGSLSYSNQFKKLLGEDSIELDSNELNKIYNGDDDHYAFETLLTIVAKDKKIRTDTNVGKLCPKCGHQSVFTEDIFKLIFFYDTTIDKCFMTTCDYTKYYIAGE